ncbi:MAG: hypothetical protein GC179_20400 [Anaerolineaceae bacterium]|nr:hypothetical protein [Anaerolineaceae bacterium]
MIRRSVILLALLLAACNLSVPEVTPTIAPTRTPSPTPLVSNTPQPTIVAQIATTTPTSTPSLTATFFVLPSDTLTPTITQTNQPSATASFTPTLTLTSTPTSTFTATLTPTATLTNAPTATSSFTPTNTATNTPLPTATATIPPSETPLPSPTPLPLVPTDIPTLTLTLTSTPIPSATFTNAPTATSSFTPTITLSPTPLPTSTPLPTFTPSDTATNEPTATSTLTPSNTPRPLPSATRTLSPEELAAFNTPIAPVGQPPTPTQAEVALEPTLDVTPTFITAQAPIIETPLVTPIEAQVTPQEAIATATAQPTVALIVTLPGIVTAIPIAPVGFNPPNVENRVFGLTTSGGVTGGGFSLLNDTVLFERNPVDPNLYVTTDSSGNLYLTGLNGAGAYRPDMSPFSQFVALSRDENNAFVPRAKWSPDGRFLAFIVAGKKTGNDGVWFFQPGQFPPVQLLVDCLPLDVPGCSLVSNPYDPDKWESQSLLWSPNSDAVMVGLNLPQEGRGAIVILSAVNDPNYRITRPPVYRYDYGAWSRDGQYILVSGRGPDGHEYVGWLNRDGSFNTLLIDSEAAGLWMGFASQANDGSVYALGAPGDRNGPREALHIYNMNGQAVTGAIGSGFPDRVEWSPDGRAVFVQTGGRQYIANINGDVRDITGQVAGARAINWVNGELPQGNDGGGANNGGIAPVGQPDNGGQSPQLPQGVVEGTEYQPGTQLRVYVQELNIRQSPGVNSPLMRDLPLITGDYVVILAGPVDMDGARWWQVQTADGLVGWVAGAINGLPTLGQ